MPFERPHLLRFVIYVCLYVAATEFAVLFITLPSDVTLIWPPAGVAYAVLVFHGARWWPVIPVSLAMTHVLVTPAPWAFVPFSLASNTAGTLLAVLWVARIAGKDTVTLRVASGFVLLVGGILSAVVSGIIGIGGMVVAAMIPPQEFMPALGKWISGDVFGIIAVTPFMLMVLRAIERRRLTDSDLSFAGRFEKALWVLASAAGIYVIAEASVASPAYALGLSFLPLAFLLWSALRFEPIFTAISLFDMDRQFADVVKVDEVLAYLGGATAEV